MLALGYDYYKDEYYRGYKGDNQREYILTKRGF